MYIYTYICIHWHIYTYNIYIYIYIYILHTYMYSTCIHSAHTHQAQATYCIAHMDQFTSTQIHRQPTCHVTPRDLNSSATRALQQLFFLHNTSLSHFCAHTHRVRGQRRDIERGWKAALPVPQHRDSVYVLREELDGWDAWMRAQATRPTVQLTTHIYVCCYSAQIELDNTPCDAVRQRGLCGGGTSSILMRRRSRSAHHYLPPCNKMSFVPGELCFAHAPCATNTWNTKNSAQGARSEERARNKEETEDMAALPLAPNR